MTKTVLIAGAGANQIGIIQRAREMGLRAVALDGNPEAAGFAHADAVETGDLRDGNVVAEAAAKHGASGIYPFPSKVTSAFNFSKSASISKSASYIGSSPRISPASFICSS